MLPILLVDDDDAVRGILFDLLSSEYECHTASTAEQAAQYLEVEQYGAVLTDIAMPGLNGVDLLRRVQQRSPSTPVILISGKGSEEDGEKLISMGAFAYVTKPFKVEEIERLVAQAVQQRDAVSKAG
jgi:DNA-binding NtrC family response regulator